MSSVKYIYFVRQGNKGCFHKLSFLLIATQVAHLVQYYKIHNLNKYNIHFNIVVDKNWNVVGNHSNLKINIVKILKLSFYQYHVLIKLDTKTFKTLTITL